MEKKNKIILISIILVTLCVIGICVYGIIDNNDIKETDAVKFQSEYMELNDKVNEMNGKAYVNVTLSDENTVKYVSEAKAAQILEEGTGVIYFGFSTCPWCRSLVTTLAKVAEAKNETIYYLDVLNIRSTFEVEEGKLNKTREGSKGYYKLLELLDEKLEEFYLVDEAGNKYDTNEKRLYAPTLVAVEKGEITGFHVGTVDSQESGYDKLTDDQIVELEKIVKDLIDSKNKTEVCTKDNC